MPWPTRVTALASSLLVSWAFFLGCDDPQEMGRSYTLGKADEKDPAPLRRASQPYSQGHLCWDIASASSMRETCFQAWNHTHVGLSFGKVLNVIHTRSKSLTESGVFSFTSYQYTSPLFSHWLEGRAVLCMVDKPTGCLFFRCSKFCPNLQKKGTANGLSMTALYFKQLMCFSWNSVEWYRIYFLFLRNMEWLRLSSK